MEDEIDLGKYFVIIVTRWRLIVTLTVLAAAVALAVSLIMPPTYEAMALVTVSKPNYVMNFDPRIESVSNLEPAYKAYPEMATSGELVSNLLKQLSPLPRGVKTTEDLKGMLKADQGADPSLVRLTVRSSDPQEAARIANVWSGLFITKANETYGDSGSSQVSFFQGQLQSAQADLEKAEQALVDFQKTDRSSILSNQVDSYRQTQADYLAQQRSTTYLIDSIQGLREQLANRPAGQSVSTGDQLTALLLQVKAFTNPAQSQLPPSSSQTSSVQLQISGGQAVPLQFQINNPDTLAKASVGDQIAFLDSLAAVLKEQMTENDSRAKALDPQILSLQTQIQQLKTDHDRLQRVHDVAQDTYTALSRKLDETRIAAQAAGEVRLVSQAYPPEYPTAPRKTVNTALGGILGFAVGIVGALALGLLFDVATLRKTWTTSRAPWKVILRWVLA